MWERDEHTILVRSLEENPEEASCRKLVGRERSPTRRNTTAQEAPSSPGQPQLRPPRELVHPPRRTRTTRVKRPSSEMREPTQSRAGGRAAARDRARHAPRRMTPARSRETSVRGEVCAWRMRPQSNRVQCANSVPDSCPDVETTQKSAQISRVNNDEPAARSYTHHPDGLQPIALSPLMHQNRYCALVLDVVPTKGA
ncbi:hypothetical protein B0H11DRAFT_1912525 [Mycena galericulata]|nr:hypothetical protein B0H11DRAFT_1912525 [Mycena galericulata]